MCVSRIWFTKLLADNTNQGQLDQMFKEIFLIDGIVKIVIKNGLLQRDTIKKMQNTVSND